MGINSVHAIGREDRAINSIVPPRPGKKSLRASSNRRTQSIIEILSTDNLSPIETCAAETKLIGDYLSNDLDAANRQAFENHLRACPECAAFLATYKKTIEITREFLKLQSLKTQPVKFKLRLASAL